MKQPKIEQTTKPLESLEDKLPLVLEVIPGQASEGLVDIYDVGTYAGVSVNQLVQNSLKKDWSLEDQQILGDINYQLSEGKILYKGQEVQSNIMDYAVKETTAEGEDYLYVRLKVIKPQEGGLQ
jgi:hypothetical protein